MEYPQTLTRKALTDMLTAMTAKPAVTIYLPTHRASTGPNTTEDQIRCKNLFRQAREILTQHGDGSKLTDELATLQTHLLDDQAFWGQTTDGLVICAAPGHRRLYYLPITTEEYVAVDDRFHLAPLFCMADDMQDYYVLALAQHAPALYKATAFELEPTDLVLPKSVEAALNIDELNSGEQQRSAEGPGDKDPYNGRGGAKDLADADRNHFWRIIDNLVLGKTDETLPLILAGTDSEIAEFRAISRYGKIMDAVIAGSYGGANQSALAAPAAAIIERDVVEAAHQQVVNDFMRLNGRQPERTAADISALRDAAAAGRIESLLIGMLRLTADTVQDNKGHVPVLTFQTHDEAVHLTAQTVWQAGGKVVNIEPSKITKSDAGMVAVLRY